MKGRIAITTTALLFMLVSGVCSSGNLAAHAGSCNPDFDTESSEAKDSAPEKSKWVNNSNVRGPLLTHARNARLGVKSIKIAMKRMLTEVALDFPEPGAVTNVEREPNANEAKMIKATLLSVIADLAAIEQLTKDSELPAWVDANPDGGRGADHPGVSTQAKQAWKEIGTLSAAAQETADAAKGLGPFRPQGYRWRKELNMQIPKLYEQVGKLEMDALLLETDRTIRQFDFESADEEEKNNP